LRSGPLRPISGGILNGKALSLPMPFYPDPAKRARISGVVEVEVVIDISGKVISTKAVRGPGMLQQAAEMAARQARFTPTLLSGQPMKVVGVITYNFTLQP
jgi:protein TonB